MGYQASFGEIEAIVDSAMKKDLNAFVLPESVIDRMQKKGVNAHEIETIVGGRATRSSVEDQGMLTVDASERAARLARVVSLAQKVFGSDQKAFLWLRAPSAQLGGGTPIDCLRRETGARLVEDILIRIDHGIAA